MRLKKSIGYYLFASYRRKLLDKLLINFVHQYHGIVLDIGGRDRGKFRSPKNKVNKWIVADIEPVRNPDMLLDVCNMHMIGNESIDTVNALELFEHVEDPETGLRECHRVLKQDGTMIISMPFLYPIHADPNDFQRWTSIQLRKKLEATGFHISKLKSMGGFFTVLGDMLKVLLQANPIIKYLSFPLIPVIDCIVAIDRFHEIRNHHTLGKYTTGYFIVAKKG